ncbi:MAG: S41 family peptidase [bacterium]
MRNSTKTPLLILAGLVAAILLVWGGLLLGLNPGVRGAVRGALPSSVVRAAGGNGDLGQEILDKLESTYYMQVDGAALTDDAIRAMIAGLDDPYTVYMDPEEYDSYREHITGSYSGVGMTVEMKDGLVTIVATFKGSPAQQAGIRPGDIILAVDGLSTEGQNLDEVVGRIKGLEETTVSLTLYRPVASTTTTIAGGAGGTGSTVTSTSPTTTTSTTTTTDTIGGATADASQLPPGGETKDYTLTRKTIVLPVVESEVLTTAGKKVALIRFFTFSDGSAAALRAEVQHSVETDGAAAIILDLRSNTGGLLNEAVSVASIFIPDGVIVTTEGLHSPKEIRSATGQAFTQVPLYVLTDQYTASASEIVSGALQDDKRATLVGETTFGKGLVQTIEPLSNGGVIKVTTAVYYTPNGRDINKTGIAPDVVAADDPNTVGVDEAVQAALKLISGPMAAN